MPIYQIKPGRESQSFELFITFFVFSAYKRTLRNIKGFPHSPNLCSPSSIPQPLWPLTPSPAALSHLYTTSPYTYTSSRNLNHTAGFRSGAGPAVPMNPLHPIFRPIYGRWCDGTPYLPSSEAGRGFRSGETGKAEALQVGEVGPRTPPKLTTQTILPFIVHTKIDSSAHVTPVI